MFCSTLFASPEPREPLRSGKRASVSGRLGIVVNNPLKIEGSTCERVRRDRVRTESLSDNKTCSPVFWNQYIIVVRATLSNSMNLAGPHCVRCRSLSVVARVLTLNACLSEVSSRYAQRLGACMRRFEGASPTYRGQRANRVVRPRPDRRQVMFLADLLQLPCQSFLTQRPSLRIST